MLFTTAWNQSFISSTFITWNTIGVINDDKAWHHRHNPPISMLPVCHSIQRGACWLVDCATPMSCLQTSWPLLHISTWKTHIDRHATQYIMIRTFQNHSRIMMVSTNLIISRILFKDIRFMSTCINMILPAIRIWCTWEPVWVYWLSIGCWSSQEVRSHSMYLRPAGFSGHHSFQEFHSAHLMQ